MDQGKKVLVLGAGNFGTCLAQHLAQLGHQVTLWARSASVVSEINQSRRNPKYLTQFELHPSISARGNLSKDLLRKQQVIVSAIPTQYTRDSLESLVGNLSPDCLLITAAKGIENKTLAFPRAIMSQVLGESWKPKIVVLSGPSFAIEVMQALPTGISLASQTPGPAVQAQSIFHAPFFRAYTSEDPIGLELAGALKNIIAIASGACIGLGYQSNSLAALLTRGLAEITRLGVAMGANPLTFNGLGGVGDLFLTCTSEKSRNYSTGQRLAKGQGLKDIVETMGSVAEGIATTKAAHELARSKGVETPIIDEVYQVLYADKPIAEAVQDLLTREAGPEISLPVQRD